MFPPGNPRTARPPSWPQARGSGSVLRQARQAAAVPHALLPSPPATGPSGGPGLVSQLCPLTPHKPHHAVAPLASPRQPPRTPSVRLCPSPPRPPRPWPGLWPQGAALLCAFHRPSLCPELFLPNAPGPPPTQAFAQVSPSRKPLPGCAAAPTALTAFCFGGVFGPPAQAAVRFTETSFLSLLTSGLFWSLLSPHCLQKPLANSRCSISVC